MPEPLLSVRDLAVTFPVAGRSLRAVDGVSLAVPKGSVLGLVGESGCGKTTVARCITGQTTPTSGTVSFGGTVLGPKRSTAERRSIQMIFQDPYASLNPRLTVRQTLSELLRVHGLAGPGGTEARCQELVTLVGLPVGALDGFPGQFSGGQRQRIAIARALAVEPDLIVADEPVSALDVSVQATILALFADLRDRLGLTFLFISHNLAVVRELCDRVAVMYLGRLVEEADRETLFADPRHPYTRTLLDAAPRLDHSPLSGSSANGWNLKGGPPSPLDVPSGCSFHPRCPDATDRCAIEDPSLLPLGSDSERLSACLFRDDLAPYVPRTGELVRRHHRS